MGRADAEASEDSEPLTAYLFITNHDTSSQNVLGLYSLILLSTRRTHQELRVGPLPGHGHGYELILLRISSLCLLKMRIVLTHWLRVAFALRLPVDFSATCTAALLMTRRFKFKPNLSLRPLLLYWKRRLLMLEFIITRAAFKLYIWIVSTCLHLTTLGSRSRSNQIVHTLSPFPIHCCTNSNLLCQRRLLMYRIEVRSQADRSISSVRITTVLKMATTDSDLGLFNLFYLSHPSSCSLPLPVAPPFISSKTPLL